MAKKNITNTLLKGSARQRATLLTEHIARGKLFQERLLSENEFKQLSDSFKTDREIKVYNEFRKLDETVTNSVVNLQGAKAETFLKYANIRGYILYWLAMENAEQLANEILYKIKDTEERIRIAKNSTTGVFFLFSEIEPDEEGYLEIKTHNPMNSEEETDPEITGSFWDIINRTKEEAERSIIKYLSWEKATLDYMEENNFKAKTYLQQIELMRAQIETPVLEWNKYKGKSPEYKSSPILDKIMSRYNILPEVDKLSADETEYSWYKKYFLESERYPDELRGKVNSNLF